MRLGHDQVVSVWEKTESILEEVDRSAIDSGFHTEERDCEGVLGILRWVRDHGKIINLLFTDLLNLKDIAVYSVFLKIWKQVQIFGVGLPNGL